MYNKEFLGLKKFFKIAEFSSLSTSQDHVQGHAVNRLHSNCWHSKRTQVRIVEWKFVY